MCLSLRLLIWSRGPTTRNELLYEIIGMVRVLLKPLRLLLHALLDLQDGRRLGLILRINQHQAGYTVKRSGKPTNFAQNSAQRLSPARFVGLSVIARRNFGLSYQASVIRTFFDYSRGIRTKPSSPAKKFGLHPSCENAGR